MANFLSSSRYVNTAMDVGSKSVPIALAKPLRETKYKTFTTREGDSFDLIALDVFGDPMRYWEIAQINPHVPFPDEIPSGTYIRLPTS